MTKNLQKNGSGQIRSIYNYLALFATLMMIIGGGIGVFMSLADIIFPEPHYQSFDEYKEYRKYRVDFKSDNDADFPIISDEDLRSDYEKVVEDRRERQVIIAQNRLFKSFAWLLIPIPVFLYFQKRTSKKKSK